MAALDVDQACLPQSSHHGAMRLIRWIAAAALALVAGCSAMLPRGGASTPSPFDSYAQAQAAAERILPFQTRVAELQGLGFDAAGGTNVTAIPYPDLLARLAPYSGVPMDALDPGIRQCILARASCRAWVFHFERMERDREGGFLADFFNVNRVTRITGWSFDVTVVASEDLVLFRNAGGQARIDRVERQHNPLGPLQPAGESAGSLLTR